MTVALSGQDTIMINQRVLTDLPDGDCVILENPNETASVKTGKNGNSIYALNESGKQADVKIRVLRGSSDDKFFNNLVTQQQANFAGFVLMNGKFIKKIGDGEGNITKDTYIMGGGIFSKLIPAKMNVEGDVSQAVSEYSLKFSNAPRTLG